MSVLLALVLFLFARPVFAQPLEPPPSLPAVSGSIHAGVQIDRRLFIAGSFDRIGPAASGAALVDLAGAIVPGGLPVFDGSVTEFAADGHGGLFAVGTFTQVDGRPQAGFAHVLPDGTLDPRYRVTADGPIAALALAHGRIYLAGEFTRVNGTTRYGLAALDAVSGALSSWGASFGGGRRAVASRLAISSNGVYVSGNIGGAPAVWGLDSTTGDLYFERATYGGALAATSQRVFIGSSGSAAPGPLRAIDPFTGADDPTWRPAFGFRYLPGPYGIDGTEVRTLLFDGGRLFVGGRFDPDDNGPDHFAVLDAATGARAAWTLPDITWVNAIAVVDDAIVVLAAGWAGSPVTAYRRATGAPLPWSPQLWGAVRTVAPVLHGVALGGDITGGGGEPRPGIAAIDLDTGAYNGWTPQPSLPAQYFEQLATDGTSLFAVAAGAQFLKIDIATGTLTGALQVPGDVILPLQALAGDRLVIATTTRYGPSAIEVIDIASWTRQPLAAASGGEVRDLAVDGDTVYLAGGFTAVNGVARPYLAAIDRLTGAVRPWDPAPDAGARAVRAAAGRVWVGGEFRRIGGARRRGLAELDAATAKATGWNPDVPAGVAVDGSMLLVAGIERAPDGTIFAALSAMRPTVSGRETAGLVALDADGRRLALDARLGYYGAIGLVVTADCAFTSSATSPVCRPPGLRAPAAIAVGQAGALVTLCWKPAPGHEALSSRIEVGTSEGRSDLLVLDVPTGTTAVASPLPAGGYFARVRTMLGSASSPPTPDVSFAVGPPAVPAAPLDPTAVTEGTQLTLRWRPPSTGAPPAYLFEAGTTPGGSGVASLVLGGGTTSYTIEAPPGRYWGRLFAVNGAGRSRPSPELLIDVDTTSWGCTAPPGAPVDLQATVAAGRVRLDWSMPTTGALPQSQQVIAGSAPGLADLAVIPLPGGAITFETPAPSGTYFVRVIGGNSCGAAVSSEVQVTVP